MWGSLQQARERVDSPLLWPPGSSTGLRRAELLAAQARCGILERLLCLLMAARRSKKKPKIGELVIADNATAAAVQ